MNHFTSLSFAVIIPKSYACMRERERQGEGDRQRPAREASLTDTEQGEEQVEGSWGRGAVMAGAPVRSAGEN